MVIKTYTCRPTCILLGYQSIIISYWESVILHVCYTILISMFWECSSMYAYDNVLITYHTYCRNIMITTVVHVHALLCNVKVWCFEFIWSEMGFGIAKVGIINCNQNVIWC